MARVEELERTVVRAMVRGEELERAMAREEGDDDRRAAKSPHASRSGAVRGRDPMKGTGERLRGGRNLSDQSFPDAPSSTPPPTDR